MKRNVMLSTILAGGLMLGGTAAAFAASPNSQELSDVMGAKTSMEQALTIAQKTTGGEAIRIAFADNHGQPVYRIRTLTKNGMDKVTIDAASGRVVSVASAEPSASSGSSTQFPLNLPEYAPDHHD